MPRLLIDCITVADLVCWVACFYWMFRISARQDAVLRELHEQTQKVKHLSRQEHELIKEIHPMVNSIAEDLRQVSEEVLPGKM